MKTVLSVDVILHIPSILIMGNFPREIKTEAPHLRCKLKVLVHSLMLINALLEKYIKIA